MKAQTTIVTIEVTHAKDILHLANMIAGRAYTISGVSNAQVIATAPKYDELRELGFSASEISLAAGEVHRS